MVLPLIEISSSPSSPNTVIAWRAPSRCSTRIWMPTRSGWNTPISWFGAPAGLVSGPRMLKIVRTPSSLAHRRRVFHRRVVARRKHEADAGLVYATAPLAPG